MQIRQSSTPRARVLPALWIFAATVAVQANTPAAAQALFGSTWMFEGPGCRAPESGAGAPAPAGACADEHLLRELSAWLSVQGGLPAVQRVPKVAILDLQGLASRLCPQSPADCAGIMAAYDAPNHTIILRDFLDMRRASDRSFLVHELVHAAQHQQQGPGFQARCSDVVSSEREAYQVQNRYLAAQGQAQRVGQMVGRMTCPREDGEPVLRMGSAAFGSAAIGSAASSSTALSGAPTTPPAPQPAHTTDR